MKNINFKKLISAFLSLCIIMGMALITFATDVDMAAFVTKDEYLTKYQEIDYRVSDIDNRLDRLYKFTCTNVRTYAGSVLPTLREEGTDYNPSRGVSPFYTGFGNIRTPYYWFTPLYANLSNEGYLIVNTTAGIGGANDPNRSETVQFEKSYPASILKWRDGIEPGPECNVKIIIKKKFEHNSSDIYKPTISSDVEIVMGPFDKYPNPTSAGEAYNQGWICTLPESVLRPKQTFSEKMYYQTGTKTEPTTWRELSKGSSNLSVFPRNSGDSIYNLSAYTSNYASNEAYHNRFVGIGPVSELYYSGGLPQQIPGVNNGNIWLRFTSTTENFNFNSVDSNTFNITNWNVK